MLEILQQKLYESILHVEANYPDFICSSYPAQRLQVYRQTILENWINALALTFPGVWQLLGKPCADRLARSFCNIEHHLPVTGCLDDWGEAFIVFLAHQPALQPLPYLAEYAQYEWLKHQAYCASILPAIDPQQLAAIAPGDMETLQFGFIPSMRLMCASFALDKIQHVLQDSTAPHLTLTAHTTYALIARTDTVTTWWIASDLATFINQLQQGLYLSHACDHTLSDYPQFNVTEAFCFLLQHQLISHVLLTEAI
jgi:hypothetical protein